MGVVLIIGSGHLPWGEESWSVGYVTGMALSVMRNDISALWFGSLCSNTPTHSIQDYVVPRRSLPRTKDPALN